MKYLSHLGRLFALGIGFASADTTAIDQSLELVAPPTGAKFISWHGEPGHSYFVQISDPASYLNKWHFAPIIEAGNGQDISYEVDGTADKGFFRLKYTDQVPGPGETLDTADFDGDGLSNWDEINIYHTDPLNPDTDGDGIPDGWEVAHGLNPNDSSDAANQFPGSEMSYLQAFKAGVQANPNATPADKDGDGIANDADADPDDRVINWVQTQDPQFVAIELPVDDPDSVTFNDLSESGTVLLSKSASDTGPSRLLIDTNQNAHTINLLPPELGDPIGYFGAFPTTLIGDQVLGTRLLSSGDQDCTWDAVTNTYTPFTVNWYIDDIYDDRQGFRVERFLDPLTWNYVLLTPYGYLSDSENDGMEDARIEKNGNIVDEGGYWRYTSASASYGSKSSLPETAFARSATLVQYEVNPETGLPTLAHTWNLVAGSTRLLVSENNGEFVKAKLALGGTHRPIGVTCQGWVAAATEIWSNGTWKPLTSLLIGDQPSQATLLGILDTGLGVAKIKHESGQTKIALLVPVQLTSDLNNDGKITAADDLLRKAALKDDATEQEKNNGTEYMFVNDKMSNGAWDVEDDGLTSFSYSITGDGYGKLPKPPSTYKADDDAEALMVQLGINKGLLWFAHSAISKMEFFKSKECKSDEKMIIDGLHPLDLSCNTLPDVIYVRVKPGTNVTEYRGNLQMHWGMTVEEPVVTMELPLTVVQQFGAPHYFHAARDYILENNSRLFVRDEGYPLLSTDPDTVFRLCVMREEATDSIRAFDATKGNDQGIEGCAFRLAGYPAAVIINGNQCFWNNGWSENNLLDLPNMIGNIVDRCHGRVIGASTIAAISSDNYDPTTKPANGSVLAGPDPIPAGMIAGPDGLIGTSDDIPNPDAGTPGGKFIAYTAGPGWNFSAGQADGDDALGGLSTYYDNPSRQAIPHQMIGHALGIEQGKGCIFTATEIKGFGYVPTFAAYARTSGVPPLSPSADSAAIQLFILDSGAGSLALMHIDPSGAIRSAYIGRKSKFGFPYYVNNYFALCPTKARP